MAINIVFDDSRGAQSQREGQASREVRIATVTGLDTTGVGPEAALVQLWSHPQMPQPGTPHPVNPNALYRRGNIVGLGTSGAARLELVYDSFGGGTPSVSIIKIRARNEYVETKFMPGSRIPFRASLKLTGTDEKYNVPEETLSFRFKSPAPTVSIFKLSQGSFDMTTYGTIAGIPGRVNNAKWMNRPVGHWLIDDYSVEISQFNGFYTTQAIAIAHPQPQQDWSITQSVFNSITGKFAKIKDDDIYAETQRPYKYGVITPPDVPGFFAPDYQAWINAQWTKGFMRVGMYPLTNFTTLFGFDGNTLPNYLPL